MHHDTLYLNGHRFLTSPLAIPVGILGWIFVSLCLSSICKKAGKPGGCLVWVPILQVIPAMEVAGMSLLWLIALFVPLAITQIVFALVLGLGLARARKKDPIWGVLLVLPCTAWLGLLYLAVAD